VGCDERGGVEWVGMRLWNGDGRVQLVVWVSFKIYIKIINRDISKNPKCSKKDDYDASNTKPNVQLYTAPLKYNHKP